MYRPRKARIYKGINQYIQKKLVECNVTKKNLAVAIGTTEGAIETKLKDIRALTIKDALIISGVFGVPVEVFVAAIVRNMSPTIVEGSGLSGIVAAKVAREVGE